MKNIIIDNDNLVIVEDKMPIKIILSKTYEKDIDINLKELIEENKIRKYKIILKDMDCIYKIICMPKFSKGFSEKIIDRTISNDLKINIEDFNYSHRLIKKEKVKNEKGKTIYKNYFLLVAYEKIKINKLLNNININQIVTVNTLENILSEKLTGVYRGDYYAFYSNKDNGLLLRYIDGKLNDIRKVKSDSEGCFVKAFNDVFIFYGYQQNIDNFILINEENLWIDDYFNNLNIKINNKIFYPLDYEKILAKNNKIIV